MAGSESPPTSQDVFSIIQQGDHVEAVRAWGDQEGRSHSDLSKALLEAVKRLRAETTMYLLLKGATVNQKKEKWYLAIGY